MFLFLIGSVCQAEVDQLQVIDLSTLGQIEFFKKYSGTFDSKTHPDCSGYIDVYFYPDTENKNSIYYYSLVSTAPRKNCAALGIVDLINSSNKSTITCVGSDFDPERIPLDFNKSLLRRVDLNAKTPVVHVPTCETPKNIKEFNQANVEKFATGLESNSFEFAISLTPNFLVGDLGFSYKVDDTDSAGVTMDNFPDCSEDGRRHCVSSQAANDSYYYIEPIASKNIDETWLQLKDIFSKSDQPGGLKEITGDSYKIVTEREGYIHVTATTFMGWVDDIEFLLDSPNQTISISSEARVGYSDFGMNRYRLELIREKLQ